MFVSRITITAAPQWGLLLLLAGCASMSGERPKSMGLPANTLDPGSDIYASDPVAWPDSTWWKDYGDPQLNDLVAAAVAGSPRMASAQARIDAARGLARVSGAALLPTVEGGAEFERTRYTHDYIYPDALNGFPFRGELWNNDIGVTFSYSFDIWGRDRAALDSALDRVKVSQYEAQSVRLTLEGAVIRSYAELAYAYEIEDHDDAILTTEKKTLDLAARRLQAGLGTELEIQQASNAVAATQAQLEEVANRMSLLRHQLAALCGQGPGAGDALQRPTIGMTHIVGLPSRIPAELVGRRPDVQAERWRVESAGKDIAVAKAAFYPNVDLKSAVGFLGFGFSELVSNKALNASVGPAISLPIFEGGRLRAGLAVRNAQYDLAVDAYNAAVIEALREVADQISKLSSLQTLRVRREETFGYAKRANELAQIAFRAGLTDYNNVLTTEDSLHRAQNLIAEVGLQQIEAVAALDQALGGGLLTADAVIDARVTP